MKIKFSELSKSSNKELYEYLDQRFSKGRDGYFNNVEVGILEPFEAYQLLYNGSDIIGYNVYINVSGSSVLNLLVDEGISDRLDESGNTKTYSAWTRNIYEYTATTEVIFEGSSNTQSITLEELEIFLNKDEFEVIDVNEFKLRNDYYLDQQIGIEYLVDKWKRYFKDWKQLRTYLTKYTNDIGFVNLSDEEKEIIAFHHGVDINNILSTLQSVIKIDACFDYVNNSSRSARIVRFNFVRKLVRSYIGSIDVLNTYPLVTEVGKVNDFEYSYVTEGIEGTTEPTIYFDSSGNTLQDQEGFFDYINATTGSGYEFTGLRSKTFDSITQTELDDFCDTLLIILRYGQLTIPFYI